MSLHLRAFAPLRSKKIIFFCSLFFGLHACMNNDEEIEFPYTPHFIVEGRIENDEYPMVIFSQTAPFAEEMDTTFLLSHIIKSAKVTVSSDTDSEILALGVNENYLPPYVYYGNRMKGEIGKTYRLKIEYKGGIISAETYIPQPVPLQAYRFVKEYPNDTTGYIHVSFYNTITSGDYYQLATRTVEKETVFTPCLYGNINGKSYREGELISMQLNKGPIIFPESSFDTYFKEGETVQIKIRTQPRHGYDFWTSWQNEIINAQNPIFPAISSLKSNIQGGIGIWCGYGSYTYRLNTKEGLP